MNRLDFFGSGAKTVLAPMAGYTDAAFRTICRGFGAALTVTEMVSSKALVMNNSLTETLLKRFDDAPCFVQIFGHEPQVMADSVQLDKMQDFEGLDINMGCPVRKIVSNGDGSALMQNPALASRCIAAVRKVWTKPPFRQIPSGRCRQRRGGGLCQNVRRQRAPTLSPCISAPACRCIPATPTIPLLPT